MKHGIRTLAVLVGAFLIGSVPPPPASSASLQWNVANISGEDKFTDISCPTESLCVAVGRNDATESYSAATSSDPTGGPATWNIARKGGFSPGFLPSVSCPTESLCVAVGGNVIATTADPTGGAAAWHFAFVSPSINLFGISGPTESLCVATGSNGAVLTSASPTAGADGWNAVTISGPDLISDVSCPSVSLCVATRSYSGGPPSSSGLLTSTNPTGGAGAWSVAASDAFLSHISCPSESLCVATGSHGEAPAVSTSANPTGGAGAWNVAGVPVSVASVSCSSASWCAAVGSGGVLTSTDPMGGTAAWRHAYIGIQHIAGVSCPADSLCVAADLAGNVAVGRDESDEEGNRIPPPGPVPPLGNAPPVAACDVYRVPFGSTLRVPAASGLLSNDADPEGGKLHISAVKTSFARKQKAFRLNRRTGALRFNPGPVRNPRSASMVYTVADPHGKTSQGKVKIYIGPRTLPHDLGLLGCSSTNMGASTSVNIHVNCFIQQLGKQGFRGRNRRPKVRLRTELWCAYYEAELEVMHTLRRRFRTNGSVRGIGVALTRGYKHSLGNHVSIQTDWIAPWRCRGKNRKKIKRQRRNIGLFAGLVQTEAFATAPGAVSGQYGDFFGFSLTCSRGNTIFANWGARIESE